MILDRLDGDLINIICAVEGVYPKPELVILAGNRLVLIFPNIDIIY